MENLNAEQVKNMLEQLSLVGCMTGVTIKGHSVVHLLRDALALINSQEQRIKELTAENERLRENNKQIVTDAVRSVSKLTEENERLMREKTALECVISTARNQATADTVRKMQERLKKQVFSDATPHDMDLLHCFIDGVAKEMLEGG